MLKESQVYNHWDIVYSCFVPDEMLSEHRLSIHALIYVYSGEMVVEDDGRTLTVGAGNYVFLKRDHQVKLLKHTTDSAPYKAISIKEVMSAGKEKGMTDGISQPEDGTEKPQDKPKWRMKL